MSLISSVRNGITRLKYLIDNSSIMKTSVHSKDDRDLDMIYKIQPTGNFKPRDNYVVLGDGYMSCIHVYSVPDSLVRCWMFQLCNKYNVITTIDIETIDKAEAEESLNKAINEYDSRLNDSNSNKRSVEKNAANIYYRLDSLLDEVSVMGNSLKALHIRLYVYGRTFEMLMDNLTKVKSELDDNNFLKHAENVNETVNETMAFMLPASEQNKTLSGRKGVPCSSDAVAFGLPFHYEGWIDPHGFWFGDTPLSAGEGPVIFDPYALDKHRNSYDGVVVGDKGSGKSTTLKMLIEFQICTGNKVRIIDVTSEFNDITERYGGIVINMDGSSGKLNPLQILRMEEDDSKNYMMHISKMSVMYQLKNPQAKQDVVDLFKAFLKEVYIKKGVITVNNNGETIYTGCTSLPPQSYPIYTDVQKMLIKRIKTLEKEAQTQQASKIQIEKYLEIKSTIDDIVENYGSIFNGHTTIGNLMDANIICFDIRAVSDMEPSIFDMQLFNVLSMAYDSCMTIGVDMKKKFDKNQIKLEDVIHHTIYVDECHKTINSQKLFAVRRMLDILRQDRKYFIGVWFATQNIADMFPNSKDISDELKTMFSLCQYKLVFKQDETATELISKVLGARISPYQLMNVPRFGKSECLLNIGNHTIQMTCKQLDRDTLSYYGGGA